MIGINRVVLNLWLAQIAFNAGSVVNVHLLVNRKITDAPLFAHDNRVFLVPHDRIFHRLQWTSLESSSTDFAAAGSRSCSCFC